LAATQKLLELLQTESEHLAQKTDPTAISLISANKREVVVQLELFTNHLGQILDIEN